MCISCIRRFSRNPYLHRFVLFSALLIILGNQLIAEADLTPADKRLVQALRSYISHVMKQSRTSGLRIAPEEMSIIHKALAGSGVIFPVLACPRSGGKQ